MFPLTSISPPALHRRDRAPVATTVRSNTVSFGATPTARAPSAHHNFANVAPSAPQHAGRGAANGAPVIQRITEEERRQQAERTNQFAREVIPYSGNQILDLLQDQYALGRHEQARYLNRNVLGGDPSGNRLTDVLNTYESGRRTMGGMCNEYSATCFAGHMHSPVESGQQVVRYWNPTEGHSFTVHGDPRTQDAWLTDPWATSQEVMPFHQSTLSQMQDNQVVNTWTDRYQGAGRRQVQEHTTRTDQALQNLSPYHQNQLTQIFNINWHNQQRAMRDYTHGPRPTWLFNVPTYRRI